MSPGSRDVSMMERPVPGGLSSRARRPPREAKRTPTRLETARFRKDRSVKGVASILGRPARGSVPMITEKVATELKGSVRGEVIPPTACRYADARALYNAM